MKVLFFGLGAIGQRHVRLLKTIDPAIEIIAYRSHAGSPKEIEKFLCQYKISTYVNTQEAFAQNPTVAFITNPTALHVPVALQCAKNRMDLFIEKPLSDSTKLLDELDKEIKKNRLIVMVGFMMRYNSGLKKIKELLNKNSIGKILSAQLINGEFLPDWHPWEDYRNGYSANKNMGGGIIFNFSHELDYAKWFFGEPKTVLCKTTKVASLRTDVEDSADMLISCGTTPVNIHLDHISKPPIRRAIILGTSGRIEWDFNKAMVTIISPKNVIGEVFKYDNNRDAMFMDELQEFIKSVKTRTKTTLDFTNAKENLTLLLACHKSAATNTQIFL